MVQESQPSLKILLTIDSVAAQGCYTTVQQPMAATLHAYQKTAGLLVMMRRPSKVALFQ